MRIGRRARVAWFAVAMALTAVGCREGGELREATEARRAAGAGSAPSSAPVTAPVPSETPERLPAFIREDPDTLPEPGAGGGVDAVPRPEPEPPSPAEGWPQAPDPAERARSGWTAGVVEGMRAPRGTATLSELRAGVNDGFDRVVLELSGGVPSHRVEYVDGPVRECGSGRTVAVAGDGALAITLRDSRAHTPAGRPTVQRRNRRVDMPVIRQIVVTCDFEGTVRVVLGVSSPNAFRVVELEDPARLIVDVRQ